MFSPIHGSLTNSSAVISWLLMYCWVIKELISEDSAACMAMFCTSFWKLFTTSHEVSLAVYFYQYTDLTTRFNVILPAATRPAFFISRGNALLPQPFCGFGHIATFSFSAFCSPSCQRRFFHVALWRLVQIYPPSCFNPNWLDTTKLPYLLNSRYLFYTSDSGQAHLPCPYSTNYASVSVSSSGASS